ncbi:hypothetical protein C922_00836 [Plasmodium inui San Antonio 1]|uniref:Uncharacterized protein n=1 Tax=Plasmodium inui San Antonio 1 TaxID=1237626 RepID=W7A9R2_9APIC|nr:hypothetical protein C922_00836 [Plasmodium inui San Antonio 1]EUD68440.1 hypothetical protein C922_00836 [Plasmodium inui San Antonio 1]
MNEVGYAALPPPEPDFWIYSASYLRNAWVQWAIVFVPFLMFALYLKLTMPTLPTGEKEHPREEANFSSARGDIKRDNL